MNARERVARCASWGALAGGWLAAVESVERTLAHAPHLSGAGEMVGHLLLIFAVVWVASVLLAGAAGFAWALVAAVERALARVPTAGRRVLLGAVLGVSAGLWLVFGLTLTARLGRWVRFAPYLLLAAGAVGGALALVAPRFPRPPRVLAAFGLVATTLVAYFLNSRFAPQSSYGLHLLLDSGQWLAAMAAAAWLVPTPSRGLRRLLWVALPLSLVWMDLGFRLSPRVEALVKIRGVTSRRALDSFANALDWDGDGFAPGAIVHGWDAAPLDATEPVPLLACGGNGSGNDRGTNVRSGAPAYNLLLVTIDALRDDVFPESPGNPLGDLAPVLPHLVHLRDSSAVFDRCYAHASGTEDTFSSLFSGRYLPSVLCGVEEEEYLAARLRAAGYRTRAWCNSPPMPHRAWGWEIDVRHGETDAQVDSVLAFLAAPGESVDEAPAFAWLHLMDLHATLLKPWSRQAYDETAQRRRYAAGLAEVDRVVGRLHRGLLERGLQNGTLIVLSADHGEELGEHGHYHHNLTLYEPAVRVPLWIAGLGTAPGRRAAIVPQHDLHATLLHAAGLEWHASPGQSLLASARDAERLPPPRSIYLFLPTRGFSRSFTTIRPEHGQAAWIDPLGEHKVILRFDKEAREAYDLLADPGERWNLAGEDAAWIRAAEDSLRRRLAEWSR